MPNPATRRSTGWPVAWSAVAGIALLGVLGGTAAEAEITAHDPARAPVVADPATDQQPELPLPTPVAHVPDDVAGAATADPGADVPELACDGPVRETDLDPERHWQDIVVDPIRRLPEDWQPGDLVAVPEVGYRGAAAPRVRSLVLEDLRAMHAAARRADAEFVVVSSFRSEHHQEYVWDRAVANEGGVAAARAGTAPPGHSEHQLGTTIDVVDPSLPELVEGLSETPAGRWLAAHAAEYGFVVSYPADQSAVTCYRSEPWHLRYVGRERAAAIVAAPLSPREFFLTRLRVEKGRRPALTATDSGSPAVAESRSGRG